MPPRDSPRGQGSRSVLISALAPRTARAVTHRDVSRGLVAAARPTLSPRLSSGGEAAKQTLRVMLGYRRCKRS